MHIISTQGCPKNYTFFAHTDKCYQAVWNGGGVSRSDADAACTAQGGHLASIHNNETINFLLDLLKVRSYLGGVYVNGKWTWDDGSPWDYQNWRTGDPKSPETLNYMEFDYTLTGVWHNEDNTIGYDNGYVCQLDQGCTVENNTFLCIGGDVKAAFQVASYKDCSRECYYNGQCKGWTFNVPFKYCWLKTFTSDQCHVRKTIYKSSLNVHTTIQYAFRVMEKAG